MTTAARSSHPPDVHARLRVATTTLIGASHATPRQPERQADAAGGGEDPGPGSRLPLRRRGLRGAAHLSRQAVAAAASTSTGWATAWRRSASSGVDLQRLEERLLRDHRRRAVPGSDRLHPGHARRRRRAQPCLPGAGHAAGTALRRRVRRSVWRGPPARGQVILVPDIRWDRCDIKSTNLLANVLAIQQAKEAGCLEAIYCLPDGTLTEGTHTSFFGVLDGAAADGAEQPRHPARHHARPDPAAGRAGPASRSASRCCAATTWPAFPSYS